MTYNAEISSFKMAAPVKASMDSEMCEIEGTLPTGFESMSKEEVEEKLGVIAVTDRGKVNFKIPLDQVAKVYRRHDK